jgi:type II secretory pathway component PulJ
MAVLAVSGLLLVGMWRLYHNSTRVYQRGLQDVRVAQGARLVLRFMTRDIQQAFATALPHGIRGTNHQSPVAEADRLELTTITYPVMKAGLVSTKSAGVPQRIRYVLEPVAGEETLVLKRVSARVVGDAAERVIPLSKLLYSLSLRYFDGQAWYDTWQRTALPRAVEITVRLQSRGWYARTHRFTTVVTPD